MALTSDPNARNSYALALLRIGVGIFFLIFGQYKVFGHGLHPSWRLPILESTKFLEGGTYPFMAPVLRGFVLPHATSIAFLVAYGDIRNRASASLGILVRSQASRPHLSWWTMLFLFGLFLVLERLSGNIFGASLSHSVFAALLRRFPPRGARTPFIQ